MAKQPNFFEENDAKVNKRMTKVLLWMTLVFPALFGLNAAGIFKINYVSLTRLSCIGVFCTVGPFVLQKLGAPVKVMKYVGVLAVGFIVMLLGMNSSVGIYMTYGLALLFSCMYYDKKFTIKISVITYIMLAVSTWFRIKDAIENNNAYPGMSYIPHMMGYTLEFVVMSCVFISVASGSHKLLENLHGSQRVSELMEKCGSVSESLVGTMNALAEDMTESGRATDAIAASAKDTLNNCAQSMEHVNSMQETINEMVEASVLIDDKSAEMLDISDDICKRMESYVEQMNSAVDSMREIETSADMTNDSIMSLEKIIGEITAFVKEITNIAEQTNILAINASIESSRAGEYGKGFSVVAGEIRVLAERSKASSNSVSKTVERVLKTLGEVKSSNERNLSSVDSGISGISAAREAAAELGQLQADSRGKTEQIATSSKQTGERSRRVHEMAQQMEELMQTVYSEANAIVEETSGQKKVTDATAQTFGSVKNMADELYGLSKV